MTDVQTVRVQDADVMRLAVEALDRGDATEARRLLVDRLAWYRGLAAEVQAARRRRRA